MPGTVLKKRLIEDIGTLPEKKIKQVIDFVEYLKLKEDDWFISLVNQRSRSAKTEKKNGKRLIKLIDLQKQYQ
jgi:hypothetical protein